MILHNNYQIWAKPNFKSRTFSVYRVLSDFDIQILGIQSWSDQTEVLRVPDVLPQVGLIDFLGILWSKILVSLCD